VRLVRFSQPHTLPLVKPDASPEEVAAVIQSDQGAGGQVFAQAVRVTSPHTSCSLSEPCSLHLRRVMESPALHIAKFRNDMKTSERLNVRSLNWHRCLVMYEFGF
jgi:hypothetical protein